MDKDSVDRIRSATFPVARRGYDKHEVERFLNELADWLETGGSEEARADLVAPELERIGKQVSNILTEANDAARTMRADAEREVRQQLADANRKAEEIRENAEQYAAEAREQADAYAVKTRSKANAQAEQVRADADGYSEETRGEADTALRELRANAERTARETTDKARAEARKIVDEGNRKRSEIEKVIGDLEKRRQAVVNELRRLANDVAGAAGAPIPGREQAPEAAPSSENGGDKTAEAKPTAKTRASQARAGSSSK